MVDQLATSLRTPPFSGIMIADAATSSNPSTRGRAGRRRCRIVNQRLGSGRDFEAGSAAHAKLTIDEVWRHSVGVARSAPVASKALLFTVLNCSRFQDGVIDMCQKLQDFGSREMISLTGQIRRSCVARRIAGREYPRRHSARLDRSAAGTPPRCSVSSIVLFRS
jgi:hypothetical protein